MLALFLASSSTHGGENNLLVVHIEDSALLSESVDSQLAAVPGGPEPSMILIL